MNEKKKEACKRLWKDVFGDSDEFIDEFISFYYREENMLTIEKEEMLLSMLHLIPFRFKEESVGLIYALGTTPGARNRGYATELIKEAIERGSKNGYTAIMLIPESEELHVFYEKYGFNGRNRVKFELPTDFDFGLDNKKLERIKYLPLSERFRIPDENEEITLMWEQPTPKHQDL